MKKALLITQIVLILAVSFLLFSHFQKQNNCNHANSNASNSFKIAYFDMDSVQNNYTFYKEVAKQLTESEQVKRSELQKKKEENMAKLKEYQSKGDKMSQAEMTKAQQDLAQRDREYNMAEQMKVSEMQDESFKKMQEVKKKIEDYLKEYNKKHGYAFIITNSSDMIYYKDSVYNITKDIISDLNKAYKK